MDERELTTRIKALNKAMASNEPATSVIALMQTLKNAAAPSEDALRSSKAGHTVGKLRSNANPDIKRLASEIVNKWRKAVELEKNKKQRGAMASPGSTPSAASPVPAPSTSTKFTGDPMTRKFDSDKANINRTGEEQRDRCIGLLYNGLAFRSTEPVELIVAKAAEVEMAAYTAYNGESKAYKDKLRSLFQNLKNKTNATLGKRVLSGEISADKFVVMDSDELKSAELKKLEKDLAKENMKKAQVPMAEKSISDALQCGKCKQRKVSYSQAQTRSADEPMTTFCECMVCGNRWKFS